LKVEVRYEEKACEKRNVCLILSLTEKRVKLNKAKSEVVLIKYLRLVLVFPYVIKEFKLHEREVNKVNQSWDTEINKVTLD
jgi:hypothetical protein